MVLVTAASGNAGRRIIKEMLAEGIEVKAVDISPNVQNLKEIGVKEVVVGHVGRRHVIEKALEGCDQLLYIPTGSAFNDADMVRPSR